MFGCDNWCEIAFGSLFYLSPAANSLCVHDYTHLGAADCDVAYTEYGTNCAELEDSYSWDCAGCTCPGDTGALLLFTICMYYFSFNNYFGKPSLSMGNSTFK